MRGGNPETIKKLSENAKADIFTTPYSTPLNGQRPEYERKAIAWQTMNNVSNELFFGPGIGSKEEYNAYLRANNSKYPESVYTNIMQEYMSRVD